MTDTSHFASNPTTGRNVARDQRARQPSATYRVAHYQLARSRRDFLAHAGGGFGALALQYLLWRDAQGARASGALLRSTSHVAPRAKNVIFLFMEGGPSHLDLFDPKPALQRYAGQPLPGTVQRVITAMGEMESPVLASRRRWHQYGRSGLWVSDWLPQIARHADDLCVIRSCWANGLNHVGSVCQMNTGSVHAGRPSLGSWVNYGLGSENDNLPAFVVLLDGTKLPHGGRRNWGTGFMPSTYQGSQFADGPEPIANLSSPLSAERLRRKQVLLRQLNSQHLAQRKTSGALEARIDSFELAFRMQQSAPEAVDLGRERAATKTAYGLDQETTASMGRCCLLARRLVERGVRFVQVYCGSGSRWDAHSKIEQNHGHLCRASDQPIAALLDDLKQRGLLEETLVVWGGEFGRTPMSEKGDGRDHNPYGFTMWLAGGGVQGGQVIGATDEFGLHAIEDRVHVHDLHATILYALGIQARQLVYHHNGRPENPVINDGDPVTRVFGI